MKWRSDSHLLLLAILTGSSSMQWQQLTHAQIFFYFCGSMAYRVRICSVRSNYVTIFTASLFGSLGHLRARVVTRIRTQQHTRTQIVHTSKQTSKTALHFIPSSLLAFPSPVLFLSQTATRSKSYRKRVFTLEFHLTLCSCLSFLSSYVYEDRVETLGTYTHARARARTHRNTDKQTRTHSFQKTKSFSVGFSSIKNAVDVLQAEQSLILIIPKESCTPYKQMYSRR